MMLRVMQAVAAAAAVAAVVAVLALLTVSGGRDDAEHAATPATVVESRNPRTMFDGWKYPDDFLYLSSGGTGHFSGVVVGPSAIPAGVAAENNALAADLYGQISAGSVRGANILYSPAGAYVMLSMLHDMMAGGRTAEQIRDAVGSGMSDVKARAHVMTTINRYGPHATFDAAHAMWLSDRFGFGPPVDLGPGADRGDAHAFYFAEARVLDFADENADGTKPSVKRMNQWAADSTRGLIGAAVSDDDVGDDTVLVTGSAAYFKGAWATGFPARDTREGRFVGYGGSTAADFMNKRGTFGYHQADGAQILGMPYAGGQLSMLVVLPRDRGGLERIEEGLSAGKIAEWIGGLEDREVDVSIPKFEIRTGYDMAGPLAGMNVTDAFDEGLADLDGIRRDGGSGNPHVSLAAHYAYMRIGEECGAPSTLSWVRGTWKETGAAAGCADDVGDRAGAHTHMKTGDGGAAEDGRFQSPPSFIADRPFLFAVYDEKSGMILLMGRISDFVPTDGPAGGSAHPEVGRDELSRSGPRPR
ncbi:MAG: serpin family protein [Thaumarchaeota archaeon]|nr:serpin family protein [Nitrososphaerota archaeon]